VRRTISSTIVVLAGLLLLLDFVLINPTLLTFADGVLQLIVLLAAAAALAGAAFLAVRHVRPLLDRSEDRLASGVLLAGLVVMLIAGFYPGSSGASDAAVRWLVAALLAPLVASLFAMLFVFLLLAMRRGMLLRSRQMTVMLVAAALAIVLLLPLDGAIGDWLASVAGWSLGVPMAGVFRGLLIGVGIATAVQAARILLSINVPNE
jgi:hypothetical protein